MREPQQAEIIDVHLGARGLGAAAVADAVAAMEFGVVDENIDLAADRAGQFLDRARLRQFQRDDRDIRQLRDRVEAGRLLPGFRNAGPDDIGAGLDERLDQRLAGRALAVGDVRTFLMFGSEVISRSILSSAMLGVSVGGRAISAA